MSTTTPRLRSDLRTEPVEDAQGVLYFDVSDPKSGGVLRLFDFEWLLAQKFDGQRGFDEVARLAAHEHVSCKLSGLVTEATRKGMSSVITSSTAWTLSMPSGATSRTSAVPGSRFVPSSTSERAACSTMATGWLP